jgi:hypothetical protein
VKVSKVWKGCEGCVLFEIPPLRLKPSQVVGRIQQAPVEG